MRTSFSLPRAVLFDNDGVLSASEPLHWEAWRKLCVELGLPGDLALIRKQVGRTSPEILRALLDQLRPGWKESDYDFDALSTRKNNFYLEAARQGLSAYPEVREGLQWLRSKGIRTACVSNARSRELHAAMDLTRLRPLLDTLVSREDAGVAKPDPTPYLMAAATLGVEPGECFAVEDSPAGITASLRAKIPSFGILSHFSPEVLEQPAPGRPDLKPAALFETIGEFFTWMKTL